MKILIATDGSDFSKAAVEECCSLFPNMSGDEVKIVAVYEDPPLIAAEPFAVSGEYYQQMADASRRQGKTFTTAAVDLIKGRMNGSGPDISEEILRGPPEREIVGLAEAWNADLIVVGSHGRGFWGRLLGSVSNGVVHHAPCSVLVVRKRESRS